MGYQHGIDPFSTLALYLISTELCYIAAQKLQRVGGKNISRMEAQDLQSHLLAGRGGGVLH